ncbi:heparin lyase I family protein [Bradyrhizobium jicamae]|uniref:heparin lyase I family protein n=1 Tax=Bradyrhizobium jicamae TaxID=280332 RepID=UPI001BA55F00|nr:heparin lyase I family protein [Bradyrhizobium jicamae]
MQTSGKSYSLTNPDPQTLQFTIQAGDRAWFDGSSVDRAEIMWAGTAGSTTTQYVPAGTPIAIDYQFAVQANGPNNTFINNAWFFVTAEMHDGGTVSGTSPPFAIQLAGDHLQLVARYVLPGGNPAQGSSDLHNLVLWTDPNPIVPGKYYDINIQANVSNSGGGYLKLAIDGQQVVNYSGPLGYGSQTYWEEGLYRNSGPTESVTASFRNLTLVTGSMASGWQGVGGTTTTTNVAPTVTLASASPGTGIEHVGDTITMTLGFSEAVTVTGTPTLSLNDGAKATYVGGSGTSTLTFKTTVASTDTNTSALAITGVNLPSGTSIRDSGGLAANLAGAVKVFSGLQISTTSTTTTATTPTAPISSTTPTTPTSSVTKPVLTIADNTLWVAGRGGTVDLGTQVSTTDSNDRVTVSITGLPKYETITDGLDGRTFRGSNITLTAAQVDSGLTLQSNYRGNAHPVATLTLTATATDPITGAVASAAPQTITVTDPRPTSWTTTSSQTMTTPASTQPRLDSGISTMTATAPQPIAATNPATTTTSAGALATRGFALLDQHMGSATSTLATTSPQAIVTDPQLATGRDTASLASQSFALLNQYMAGNTGRVDPGQIVATVSQATGTGLAAFLARPH